MNTVDLLSKISKEMRYEPGFGWMCDGWNPGGSVEKITNLTYFLYQRYYLSLQEISVSADRLDGDIISIAEREDALFASGLEKTLAGKHYKSTGWKIVSRRDSSAIVERDGIALSVNPGEWFPERSSEKIATVLMPAARRYASPGFFSAYGALGPPHKDEPLDRLYVNVAQDDAVTLFSKILVLASAMETTITVKIANAAAAYDRCDTLVVYLPRRFFQQNMTEFIDRLDLTNLNLRPTSPAFTKQLKKGAAWAQDPTSDGCGPLSFGMHRCRVIARGMEKASSEGTDKLEKAILQEWQKSGLDIDAPHLSPNLLA